MHTKQSLLLNLFVGALQGLHLAHAQQQTQAIRCNFVGDRPTFRDTTCFSSPQGLLPGCNAGGQDPECRICDTGEPGIPACPWSTTPVLQVGPPEIFRRRLVDPDAPYEVRLDAQRRRRFSRAVDAIRFACERQQAGCEVEALQRFPGNAFRRQAITALAACQRQGGQCGADTIVIQALRADNTDDTIDPNDPNTDSDANDTNDDNDDNGMAPPPAASTEDRSVMTAIVVGLIGLVGLVGLGITFFYNYRRKRALRAANAPPDDAEDPATVVTRDMASRVPSLADPFQVGDPFSVYGPGGDHDAEKTGTRWWGTSGKGGATASMPSLVSPKPSLRRPSAPGPLGTPADGPADAPAALDLEPAVAVLERPGASARASTGPRVVDLTAPAPPRRHSRQPSGTTSL